MPSVIVRVRTVLHFVSIRCPTWNDAPNVRLIGLFAAFTAWPADCYFCFETKYGLKVVFFTVTHVVYGQLLVSNGGDSDRTK